MKTFDISSIIKKLMRYAVHPMLAISFEDYADHVVRMHFESCEKQLMFKEAKYHKNGRVTPSLLEQVLKFNQ